MLSIFSLAFQLAGSLTLFIFVMSTERGSVIRRFSGIGLMHEDGDTGDISYSKQAFKECFKEAYLGKISFAYLAVGYGISIFSYEYGLATAWDLICLALFTAALVLAAYGGAELLLKHNKAAHEKITSQELDRLGLSAHIGTISTEELEAMLEDKLSCKKQAE